MTESCAIPSIAQDSDVIIAPSLSDEQAKKTFPAGWKAAKPYLRIMPLPHA
jgi:thioredoxin-dependent peroxiredoxin